MSLPTEKLFETLRCPGCQGQLRLDANGSRRESDAQLECLNCHQRFPIIGNIPRLLLSPLREALLSDKPTSADDDPQVRTARSFGYEWSRFPEMYAHWEQNFLNYMQPHRPEFFSGKKVLDAGCGNGRFAFYAAKYGAEVWALDLGQAVEVAAQNTQNAGQAQVVQADLHRPPFAPESFDFIYSLGVLHHLPDPEPAFRGLLRFLKPDGEIQIYLYGEPEGQPIKRGLLSLVTGVRQITTRLPHAAVYALAFPAACAAFAFFVWPYRMLNKLGLRRLAAQLPMKQYSNLPFRVCVNDQLDRFSAPIENRYTKQEVLDWLDRAGLKDLHVSSFYGWVANGRKTPASGASHAANK